MAAPSSAVGRPELSVAAGSASSRRLKRPSLPALGWVAAAALTTLLLCALAVAITTPAARPADPLVGRPAPRLAIQSLDGPRIDLADFRGRPVVVNFWASWCLQCRDEAPVLRAAAAAYGPQASFLGADVEDSEGGARSFRSEFAPGYPVGPVVSGSHLSYGVRGVPETLVIDSRGVVVWRQRGPVDASFQAELGRLLR